MKIKEILKRILKQTLLFIRRFMITLIIIGMTIGVILYFRWGGLKGLLGFAVGVLVTGFLFMSEHPMIQVYREMILK